MRKPPWLKTTLPEGAAFAATNEKLRRHGLNTVCSSARCPNLADCWSRATATFMILGDICTRGCRFCSVPTGSPRGVTDDTEPQRVAAAARELGLRYVVITSVDRDDLEDFGAAAFAQTVRACRGIDGAPRVEVLTPDFGGRAELVAVVVDGAPDVFGHNIETVERISPAVRDARADYRRSLGVLAAVKRVNPRMTTKSGLMVGLSETDEEVFEALQVLRDAGCDIVTVGQYLQPHARCLPVARYVEPERFEEYAARARELGFLGAFCGPMVRSSFHAAEVFSSGRISEPRQVNHRDTENTEQEEMNHRDTENTE